MKKSSNPKFYFMNKKFLLTCATALLAIVGMNAQEKAFRMQGHERPDMEQLRKAPAQSAEEEAGEDKNFSFDEIKYWVGTGEKRAALVIDWHDEKLDHAMVWGYRWDGEATGYDMVAAVAKADPRFTFLTHSTNLGNTVAGLGYDLNASGDIQIIFTGSDGSEEIYTPVDGIVTTTAYNYDNWSNADAEDLWRSGWYSNGYWSYQVKESQDEDFSYSGSGASSRILSNGSWDGWSFADFSGMTGSLPRAPYEAALPAEEPQPADENAYWGQMYKNAEHQSIVELPLALSAENISVKWEYNFGGYSGQPIIVGDYMYNTSGKKIYKISVHDGSLDASGDMVSSIGFFSMIAYGDGKIFVTLGSGTTQAFDANTLESLWVAKVEGGGQQLCPVVYHDKHIYTGTWNGGKPATGKFYCLSTTDDDPTSSDEEKSPVWTSDNVGFYWSGGTIVGDCIFFGGDNGIMQSRNRLTGDSIDSWQIAPELATSTIRSGTSFDKNTRRLFFTGKEAKKIYSVRINEDGTFDKASILSTDIAGQATTTPTVYNGRVYATSGTMTSGGGLDVFDANTLEKLYSVDMGGISQSTPVVCSAFASEENQNTVYVYVCLNNATGAVVCIKDFEGNTEPIIQYQWTAPKTQYCTHSMVVDQYGTMYYKNDSRGFWALSSAFDATDVTIDQTEVSLKVGETTNLTATVTPDFASDKTIVWSSSDETIATVSADGVVTAIAEGEATITAATANGELSATCLVKVSTPTGMEVPAIVKSVYPNPCRETLFIDSNENTTAYIYSKDGRLVLVQSLNPGKNGLDVSTLNAGVYVLRCGDEIYKVIKQ